MKNAAAMINDAAGALVSLLKGLIVATVFAGILFSLPAGWGNGIDGLVNLVNSFMGMGLPGYTCTPRICFIYKITHLYGEGHLILPIVIS